MNIRKFVNQNMGYDVVRFSGHHNLRSHLSHLLKLYCIDVVLDVGANEGQYGSFIREIGYQGKIISFEPVASAFETLCKSSSNDELWDVYNFALGKERGAAIMNVSSYTSFSSLLRPSDYALGKWEGSKVDHEEEIEVRTLDDCFEQGIVPKGMIFLKMDTQGYDLEVFRGASKLLSNVLAMQSELSLIPVYETMPEFCDSITLYKNSGFLVSGFYPITRNTDLSLNEVDCVLVRTDYREQ